ncbi:MAG TPA: GNAT family N-acetyltransferase [Streptosporangiaceae bacterium]|nr:GNAT family N-acetyltransferase [Streptosporangiaceae bacterium]
MTDRDLAADSGGGIATGKEYLSLATRLLRRMRLARPIGGIWEAADFQWWWRRPRSTDAGGQLFWLDDSGEPVAAVVLTEFGPNVQCDVLVLPDGPVDEQVIWQSAIRRAADVAAEFPVRLDDAPGNSMLAAFGYRPTDGPGVVASWLDAARRPPIRPLPAGYTLLSRADFRDCAHPLAIRNGADVEARLQACSLYRPELDLMVRAPDGGVAGYGLFWADEVTGVGLVEPMRTEQAHERRGIASHVLAAGLDRLAARGCRRLKVSNDIALYLRAGFEPLRSAQAQVYARVPAEKLINALTVT